MTAGSRLPFSYRYFLSILWNRSDLSEDLHQGSVHPDNRDHDLPVSSIFQRSFRTRSSATNRKNKKMGNNVRNKKMDKGEKETFDPFVIYILDVQLLIRGRWLSTKSRNNCNYLQDRATFSNRFELRASSCHSLQRNQSVPSFPLWPVACVFAVESTIQAPFFWILYVKWIFFGIMVGRFFNANDATLSLVT